MATLKVTVPEASQNIEGIVTIKAPLEKVFEAYVDHGEHGFTGSIHEVATNERIIQTFEYLGLPERGHVALERADFAAVDPQTTEIRTLSTFQSREDRDGMVSSGMEAGWRQSVEALGRLVEE